MTREEDIKLKNANFSFIHEKLVGLGVIVEKLDMDFTHYGGTIIEARLYMPDHGPAQPDKPHGGKA